MDNVLERPGETSAKRGRLHGWKVKTGVFPLEFEEKTYTHILTYNFERILMAITPPIVDVFDIFDDDDDDDPYDGYMVNLQMPCYITEHAGPAGYLWNLRLALKRMSSIKTDARQKSSALWKWTDYTWCRKKMARLEKTIEYMHRPIMTSISSTTLWHTANRGLYTCEYIKSWLCKHQIGNLISCFDYIRV